MPLTHFLISRSFRLSVYSKYFCLCQLFNVCPNVNDFTHFSSFTESPLLSKYFEILLAMNPERTFHIVGSHVTDQ